MYRQYAHYILIGFLISCSFIYSMESLEVHPDYTEIEINDNTIAMYPTLALLPSFAERGYIAWEDDADHPGFSKINLGKLVSKISKEKQTLTRLQCHFLKKFKKISLPCVIKENDLQILRALDYMEFFELVETAKDTELHPNQFLPVKESENNSQKISKKRKRNDTVWKAKSMNDDGKLIAEAKLPLLLYRERKDKFTKSEQQKFLKKFKTVDLPYIIKSKKEKKIFDSLQFGSLLNVTKTTMGWEISPLATVPTKIIDMD